MNDAFVGYSIANSISGKILLEKNNQHTFTPASVNKLFVSLAILETLGPEFRYETTLSANSKQANSITGDVVLNMQQDPGFTRQNLRLMLGKIKNCNITGNFVVSANTEKLLNYPPGWLWDDLSFGFAAPITPYLLDQDRFKLLAKAKKHISLATNLPNNIFTFENRLYEDNTVKNCKLAVYQINNGFQLRGCMQADAEHTQYVMRSLAITKPKKYLQYWLKNYMRELHIKLNGKIIFTQAAADKTILAEHFSASLESQLRHLLAFSDNVYAEAFLKKLGHVQHTSGISDFQSGAFAVRDTLLKNNKINMHGMRYDDGSGLSRYNATTPDILNKLLIAGLHSKYKTRWLMLLATPYHDNTLRMLHLKLSPRIKLHAKTGSMTGVLSLAGYMQAAGHQAISFSIFINGINQKRASRKWLKHWVEHTLVTQALAQPASTYNLPAPWHLTAHKQHIKWHKI